jgi:anti-sigma regulatory factor (Ser/Thr protein kinase)
MQANDHTLTMRGFVTLHVPCRYSYLRIIRQSVMDLCARSGLTEFQTAQMEMAVDEACSRIIEQSYGGETAANGDPNHPGLRINLMQYKDRVVVELIDHGRGLDFDRPEAGSPEQYVEKADAQGLGLYIIKRFVDDATYARSPAAGNCLRLTKLIR